MSAAAPPWEETAGGARRRVQEAGARVTMRHPSPAMRATPPRAVPVDADGSTIDEMLELMAKQVNEVVTWTKAEGFNEAYRSASGNARGLFQAAVFNLASRAERLRKG